MDFGTQENEMRTSAGYGGSHLTKESSAEKRRLGGGVVVGNNNIIHNGTPPTVLSPYQTLDHHHHPPLQPHHIQPVPLSSSHKTDPDPDRPPPAVIAPPQPPIVDPIIIINKPAPSTKTTTTTTSASSITNNNNNVRYRECLKNHAANIGGNVYDGCGEFMPCGEEGTLEALKCAACDCHRNFHRKEVDGETTPFGGAMTTTTSSRSRSIMLSPLQLPAPPQLPSPNSGLHHHHYHHNRHHHQKSFSMVQPMSVAFGAGGAGTESSSEDLNIYNDNADVVGSLVAAPPYGMSSSSSKKRFRTKFTAEQKERMVEFAERVGWRIQKQDEDEVERFCAEVGVKRQVLRVWMHNNKNTAAVRRMQHHHDDDVDITATTGQLALENNDVETAADQRAVA